MPIFIESVKVKINPKADWRAIDSPKNKQTVCLFFCHDSPDRLGTLNFDFKFQVFDFKHFQTVKQKKTNKQIHSFGFLENLRRGNLLMVLSDL